MNRQRLILSILLLLLILSVIWSFYSYPKQRTVAKLKYPPGSRVVADKHRTPLVRSAARESEVRMLRTDLLENMPAYTEYRRDMFKPLFVDKETMLARQAAAAAAAAAAAERKARKMLPPSAPSKPVPLPSGIQGELYTFKFHGFLKKDGRKTVFLAKGRDITPLKQGATFAGRYLVTSITEQVLILKVNGTGEEIIIPLVENEPLRPVR
jgi:hypothetical protein